jgi:hypothetical protein
MNDHYRQLINRSLHPTRIEGTELLQPLWSGYGEVFRVSLEGAALEGEEVTSVVVKHINPERHDGSHPRGWHSDVSNQRKLRSYEVEHAWYTQYAEQCTIAGCRVPHCYASDQQGLQRSLVLEDLDASGYPQRCGRLSPAQCTPCLQWLAALHGHFLLCKPKHLWPTGSYWHLATRQQEWQACSDHTLRQSAQRFDALLRETHWQTLVHGDAKVANFCFSTQVPAAVAAVDFQYVGAGSGMVDVAYLLGSCLSEEDCHGSAEALLDQYFLSLQQACAKRAEPITGSEFDALERDWRLLYPIAWADFHRFLAGWSPEHQKINSYARQQTRIALELLSRV